MEKLLTSNSLIVDEARNHIRELINQELCTLKEQILGDKLPLSEEQYAKYSNYHQRVFDKLKSLLQTNESKIIHPETKKPPSVINNFVELEYEGYIITQDTNGIRIEPINNKHDCLLIETNSKGKAIQFTTYDTGSEKITCITIHLEKDSEPKNYVSGYTILNRKKTDLTSAEDIHNNINELIKLWEQFSNIK